MRTTWLLAASLLIWTLAPVGAQTGGPAPIEIPLRVEQGRLMVNVDAGGRQHPFIVSFGTSKLSTTGASRIGAAKASLTLGGVPVNTESIATVPDAELTLGGSTPAGVVGAETLSRYDVLIDVPGKRLVLKPSGRTVRWDGVKLSSPVAVAVYHDVLMRADVEVNGELYGGLVDLGTPDIVINTGAQATSKVAGNTIASFRMGYASYPNIPVLVRDLPAFRGWDPENKGFVLIGAAVTLDCALAVSFAHQEIRTCER